MKIYLTVLFTIMLLNVATSQIKIDSTIHRVKRAIIDGKKYTAILKDTRQGQVIFIVNENDHKTLKFGGKSLYLGSEGFWDFKFVDFDHDGYKDLLISYLSNVPDRQDLILYDKTHKSFVAVNNFSDYPGALNIPGTRFFYSYHRSGCADMDWDSDLFKIVKFKVVKIATISGRGCGRDDPDDKEENGIFIYKVKGTKEKLIKKLSINVIGNYKDWKWGFLADYWKHHYVFFVHS